MILVIMKKIGNKSKLLEPGGVDEYIAGFPLDIQAKLNKIRSVIREVAPNAIETVSYFRIPGYSYAGYDYNGMFVWFSYKEPYIRLHLRPPVLNDYEKEVVGFPATKSIVSFPFDTEISTTLVKKLVKASLDVMKSEQSE